MKLDFLKLPSDERRLYIEQAAIQRNISPSNHGERFFRVLVTQYSIRVGVR